MTIKLQIGDAIPRVEIDSPEPPALAPAALVEIDLPTGAEIMRASDFFGWYPCLRYRQLRDPKGIPYISAEGLEEWAEYVATDEDGHCIQHEAMPLDTAEEDNCWCSPLPYLVANAPPSHHHPGDWKESLYRVWRD